MTVYGQPNSIQLNINHEQRQSRRYVDEAKRSRAKPSCRCVSHLRVRPPH